MTNSMSAGIARTPDKPRTDDRYPSRFDTRAHVSNRHDPVVYGSADDGPLSASDLRFYDDNGYLSFDALLQPDELQSALDELQRLRNDEEIKDSDEAVIEPGSRELRSIFAVHRHNAVLRRLCAHPRLAAIARQLLGGEVYIHQ